MMLRNRILHRRPPEPGRKQRRFRERLQAYRAARRGRPRRQIPRAAVPSFFTLMNLFSGFLALVQIHDGQFAYAAWLIVLAGFFDMLDGMMARLTHSQSLFGVELDSLCDVVSFGVAPAYLVYVFGLSELGVPGLIVASLPALCGAVRLARFNVSFDGEKKDYFTGLPIPMQAAATVALILHLQDASWFGEPPFSIRNVLMPAVIVLSALMISNIPFDAAPRPSPGYIRAHPYKSIGYLGGVLLVLFLQATGLLLGLIAYLLLGIGQAGYRLVRAILEPPAPTDAAEPP